jgi:hypothetical protein
VAAKRNRVAFEPASLSSGIVIIVSNVPMSNEVTEAMELARSLAPSELAEKAYALYENFR